MGNCAEDTAKKYDISRVEQDEYAKRSYMSSARASEDGTLSREIVSVSVPQKKGKPDVVVKKDEEYLRYMHRNLVGLPCTIWTFMRFSGKGRHRLH